MARQDIHNQLFRYLLAGVIITLPFHLHVNVAFIIALGVNWVLEGDFRMKWKHLSESRFFILTTALYAWYCIEIVFAEDITMALFEPEQKASLLALPLLIVSRPQQLADNINFLKKVIVLTITSALIICVVMALLKAVIKQEPVHLFYHALAGHIGLSAIYLSLLCLCALSVLLGGAGRIIGTAGDILLSVLLIAGVVLLSSKTHIVLMLLMLLVSGFRYFGLNMRTTVLSGLIFLTAFLILVTTDNPVSARYRDIRVSASPVVPIDSITPAVYLDGASLRIIFAHFGFDILKERHAWLLGVSPGDTRHALNEKITGYHLYTGDGKSDKGYFNYNYHNQYIETLLACGGIGLMLLLWIMWEVFYRALKSGNYSLLLVVGVFGFCFITESVLERAVGIVSFSLFFSILLTSTQPSE